MTITHCRNSIKTNLLELRQIRYPDTNFDSWYLPAAEIETAAANGDLPLITLPGFKTEARPLIAILLAQDRHPDRLEPDYSLHPDYISAIQLAGGNPVFISYERVREQLETWQPGGILLPGGDFAFPPEWFAKGDAPQPEGSSRACAYLEMADYAKTHKLPTLGICGGEQILGGMNGAKLRHSINQGSPEINHRQGGYILAHTVQIAPDSLLHEITGKVELTVNSAHHEAVRADMPGNCRITATAPDGTVEAIEPQQPWHRMVLGIQWHPERLVKLGDQTELKLFKRLVEESRHVQR